MWQLRASVLACCVVEARMHLFGEMPLDHLERRRWECPHNRYPSYEAANWKPEEEFSETLTVSNWLPVLQQKNNGV